MTGNLSLVVGNGGEIDLSMSSGVSGIVACTNVTAGGAPCGSLSTASPPYAPGASCDLPNPDGNGFYPTVLPRKRVPS